MRRGSASVTCIDDALVFRYVDDTVGPRYNKCDLKMERRLLDSVYIKMRREPPGYGERLAHFTLFRIIALFYC